MMSELRTASNYFNSLIGNFQNLEEFIYVLTNLWMWSGWRSFIIYFVILFGMQFYILSVMFINHKSTYPYF